MRKITPPFRCILCTFLLLASTPLLAQTETDARQAAIDFLRSRVASQKSVLPDLTSVNISTKRLSAAKKITVSHPDTTSQADIFAFDVEDGGYVLVCANESSTSIVGYADSGQLDVTNMPQQLRAWLDMYKEAFRKISTSSTSESKSRINNQQTDGRWEGGVTTPVAPLIHSQWGQSSPFNNQCPGKGSTRTLAGCVPIALAQVLNYYHINCKGGGTLEYSHWPSESEYSIDYATTTYDWANMLDSYKGAYMQVQADAVAKLIVECGIACKASYDYDETSASSAFVALNKYYNFDCLYAERPEYDMSTEKWMKMIQNELLQKRPIIYMASDGKGNDFTSVTTSHCFIIDGIDDRNFVHVNWGWNGIDDGWYDVALLNPSSPRFYSESGFKLKHSMIFGIQPRNTDWKPALYEISAGLPYLFSGGGGGVKVPKTSLNNTNNISTQVTPISRENVNRYYSRLISNDYEKIQTFCVSLVKDGKVVADVCQEENSELFRGETTNVYYKDCFASVPQIPDGTYELRMAYVDDNGQKHPCPKAPEFSCNAVISGNSTKMLLYRTSTDGSTNKLVIENIEAASEIYAGTTFYLNMKATGSSNSGNLIFRNTETGKCYGACTNGTQYRNEFSYTFAYNGYTQQKIFKMLPKGISNGFSMPAGRYKVELDEETQERDRVTMAHDFYINVEERPDYPLLIGSDIGFWKSTDEAVTNDTIDITCAAFWRETSCGLAYANNVKSPITLKVYMINTDTGDEQLLQTIEEWTPSSKVKVNTSSYPLIGKYEIHFRYDTPLGERKILTPQCIYEDDYRKRKHAYSGLGSIYRCNYNILNDYKSDDENTYELRHAAIEKGIGNNQGKDSITLTISPRKSYAWRKSINAIKLLLQNEDNKETYSAIAKDLVIEPNDVLTVKLPLKIKHNTAYRAIIYISLYQDHENDPEYSYVLDNKDNIATLTIDNEGNLSDIKNISNSLDQTSSQKFKSGDKISIYSLDGRILYHLTYSDNFWSAIKQYCTQPGAYLLKSATHSTIYYR